MKKIITILSLPVWLLLSCNSDNVSDSDLSGKTFYVKYVDNLEQDSSNRSRGFSQLMASSNAKFEYKFKDDHTANLKIIMGSMIQSVPFTWSLDGDSLQLVSTVPATSKGKSSILIKKEAKGVYLLDGEEMDMELTQKDE